MLRESMTRELKKAQGRVPIQPVTRKLRCYEVPFSGGVWRTRLTIRLANALARLGNASTQPIPFSNLRYGRRRYHRLDHSLRP